MFETNLESQLVVASIGRAQDLKLDSILKEPKGIAPIIFEYRPKRVRWAGGHGWGRGPGFGADRRFIGTFSLLHTQRSEAIAAPLLLYTSHWHLVRSMTMSKDFIIKHMNADHGDSLKLFLEAFNEVSASNAQGAQVEDLGLDNLIIRAKGIRYCVPIDPPMKDYNEARARMVALHKESLQKLGRSEVTLTKYIPPHGYHIVIFGLCLFTYISCFQRSSLLPGSWVYEHLGYKYLPKFANFVYAVQPILLPSMVAVHLFECALLYFIRLKPYGVPLFSGLWFAWTGSCFIEGFATFQRIGQFAEQAKKGEKKE
ncbi:hypothetical protein N7468_001021 [Penicillium chermesinum]|uniref:DUF2470 domain-containing protein n=1 Tax=Penicillium chermesinum TaxID=63820 RepID=A0A9W9TWX5_9EURO|nr:uncharacterized protein N7468_001021 [Penicillium chermesinum]KAJ5246038.1 hypothetical protein N7468_001021 [Penicillium chermesinum]KAJ6144334.1 hypothetical protein N7470_008229 [Penicillium chermesinum]